MPVVTTKLIIIKMQRQFSNEFLVFHYIPIVLNDLDQHQLGIPSIHSIGKDRSFLQDNHRGFLLENRRHWSMFILCNYSTYSWKVQPLLKEMIHRQVIGRWNCRVCVRKVFTGTQQQAIAGLSHLERIIKEKSQLFVKETPKRHRPP